MPETNAIEAKRAVLDAVIAEQYRYPREVLGKTRRLHPAELLRYTPAYLLERERDAQCELFAALWSDAAPIITRARRSRYIPDRNEASALLDDAAAKMKHYAMLRDLGTEFVPASEIVETHVAAEVAYNLYCNALDKNGAQHPSECRKPKRRAVVDGHLKTGRYKMIDGTRVPVVQWIKKPGRWRTYYD